MRYLLTLLLTVICLAVPAQTVIDLHTGRVSGKTRDDYNHQGKEPWQLREDSIAYNDCVTRAFNFLHNDSLQAAQDQFEKALKLRPDAPGNSVIRHNIGRIFMARRQWNDAADLLSRILKEQPKNTGVREDRATCYIEAAHYDLALKDYEYLLILKPDDKQYHLLHAMMLSHTGAQLDAIDELDALIEDNDRYAEAYLVRAGVHTDLGNKGYARRDLDKAVSLGVPKEELLDLYENLK